MNLSMNWLNDFVSTKDISLQDYCDRMTDTGSKVEGYKVLGGDIENVVVGRIISIVPHPDSDHMVICQLDFEDGCEPTQIVTGAQNVFEGALVPVAKAPSKLPGGVTIKAGKLRGVESNGMLCSISELGLTTHDVPYAIEDGILILQEDCKPGDDIRDVLCLNDAAVEFEITSNRPDCLSVIGLARETAVSFDRPWTLPTPVVTEAGGNIADYLSVDVEDGNLCRRYAARVVRNVKIEPSPKWMRARLRAAGVRPINNIVDITNYVMLEYGQPMHAFDYAMLDGSHIIVRCAAEGETFRSLDDQDHVLDAAALVIADEKKAVALAGVMGGANSEIKDSTVTVVFESANFDGATVRIGAKKQGMRTESSGRFEKGLDPENCMPALERACELVTLLGAGEVVSGCIDVYKGKMTPATIPLEPAKINHFLGTDLAPDYMERILTDLGCTIADGTVTAPSWRADLESMNDIAEEVIRIYGYNKIVSTPFSGAVTAGSLTPRQAYKERLQSLLLGMGLYQANTFSFVSPRNIDKIGLPADAPERSAVVISNPLGEDTSVMRTTLIPGLMDVLSHNNAYGTQSAMIYELGHVYLPKENAEELPDEPLMLALGFYNAGDFYTLKGMVDTILTDAGLSRIRYASCKTNPTFHPGRCAEVFVRGNMKIATFGQIHPTVAANYGFNQPVYVAYIPFEELFAVANFKKQYKALPKYPAVTRDFAFVCDRALEVGTIEEVIRKAAGKLIEKVELFDIYTGDKIDADKKSVAYRLTFRSPDHTLTDEEVTKACNKILGALQKQLGIGMRG
ncbi:MAG: phenylalanine--tRNA ligase subunit beta [Clostridia bacterium]|nr:phenylalanine--tRNA ligase subunit beta [Clostridia bacterium]